MGIHTELYDLLGIPTNATQSEIKKAYQRKARELHPDKNKSDPNATQKFQELNQAYEILKDPKKRNRYDRFGLENDNSNAHNFDSVFDNFNFVFGGFDDIYGHYRNRTEDIQYDLKLTLEELYNGCSKKIRIKRKRLCSDCNGSGLKKGAKKSKCNQCNGRGKTVTVQRYSNNATIQKITTCDACHGTGEFVPPNSQCTKCEGNGFVSDIKELRIVVGRGMRAGETLVYKGESDEIPGFDPGDLIVRITEKKHKYFTRKKDDLFYDKQIELSQSLLGFKFPIIHLDGRILLISSFHTIEEHVHNKHSDQNNVKNEETTANHTEEEKFDIDNLLKSDNPLDVNNLLNEKQSPSTIVNHPDHLIYHDMSNEYYTVVGHNQSIVIKGEGMPNAENPFEKGNLIIRFTVNFPISQDVFSPDFAQELLKAIPISDISETIDPDDDNVYEVTMKDSTIEEFLTSKPSYQRKREEAYATNDDDYQYEDQGGCGSI